MRAATKEQLPTGRADNMAAGHIGGDMSFREQCMLEEGGGSCNIDGMCGGLGVVVEGGNDHTKICTERKKLALLLKKLTTAKILSLGS